MRPGTFPFCSTCLHQAVAMAAAGHPAPCNRQYWVNARLVKPNATSDGCDEYSPLPQPSEEPTNGETT